MSRDLDGKISEFDRHAADAVAELFSWLERDRDALIHMARGRLVEGHYRFRDRLMYEYDADTLRAEAAEEIADCVNYLARLRALTRPAETDTGRRDDP